MFNVNEEIPSIRVGRALALMFLSAFVVLGVVAGYVWWNRVPPSSHGVLLSLRAFSPPPLKTAGITDEAAAAMQGDQKLIVLAPVRISNIGKKPLTVLDLSADLDMGKIDYHSLDISADDFARVFKYYPDLAQMEGQQPLARHAVIQPGQTLQGLLIFNYPASLDDWSQRKSFDIRVTFEHAKDLVLPDPAKKAGSSSGEGE